MEHHPVFHHTPRYGASVECRCGWLCSRRWTALGPASLEVGAHLMQVTQLENAD